MTQEDIIKQEWHKIDTSIDVSKCRENGELYYKNISLNTLYKNRASGNIIPKCDNYYLPKSLEGIENNNGWLKVDKENDLLKDGMECFFITLSGAMYVGFLVFRRKKIFFKENGIEYSNGFITHYKPIEKPKPPIY